ncbi:MAG: universal stress protein, partial [Chitinophagaceae bacterium]|nr:universal stress protein [Chitinophagaceae bacterium]
NKLIAYALGQGNKDTTYILIHVVESAATRIIGHETDDLETRKDQEQINAYVKQLGEKGITSKGVLGFNDRAKEIVRLVKDNEADMLVIGAHGHSGLKDLLYGQTVGTVRHELKIPVLVVNV